MCSSDLLEKGMDYGKLPHTVIIFVCTFDYFGERLPVYTFENRCIQLPTLSIGDESEKIFVNPDSNREGLDEDFIAFLDYLHGKINKNELVEEIEKAVEKARMHKEWEVEYMTRIRAQKEEGAGEWNELQAERASLEKQLAGLKQEKEQAAEEMEAAVKLETELAAEGQNVQETLKEQAQLEESASKTLTEAQMEAQAPALQFFHRP